MGENIKLKFKNNLKIKKYRAFSTAEVLSCSFLAWALSIFLRRLFIVTCRPRDIRLGKSTLVYKTFVTIIKLFTKNSERSLDDTSRPSRTVVTDSRVQHQPRDWTAESDVSGSYVSSAVLVVAESLRLLGRKQAEENATSAATDRTPTGGCFVLTPRLPGPSRRFKERSGHSELRVSIQS